MNSPPPPDNVSAEDSDWSTVETCVRGTIAVEVRRKDNYVSGNPPLYSLRVGKARIANNATVYISPHMSVYDLEIAMDLMEELGSKYRVMRSQQSNRRVVEQKRTPRMSLSRDGALETRQTQPQTTTRNASTRYYAGADDSHDED